MSDSNRVSWLFWRCQTERGTRRRPIGIGSRKSNSNHRIGNISISGAMAIAFAAPPPPPTSFQFLVWRFDKRIFGLFNFCRHRSNSRQTDETRAISAAQNCISFALAFRPEQKLQIDVGPKSAQKTYHLEGAGPSRKWRVKNAMFPELLSSHPFHSAPACVISINMMRVIKLRGNSSRRPSEDLNTL